MKIFIKNNWFKVGILISVFMIAVATLILAIDHSDLSESKKSCAPFPCLPK